MANDEGTGAKGILSQVWTVNVWVSDKDRSKRFYVETLGFEVALDTQTFDWLELALPGGFTKIALVEPRKDYGEEYFKWASQLIGGNTGIAYETSDINALYENLSAKGVKFSGPPKKAPWGGIMTSFVDLDGNEFTVVEDKEHYSRKY